MIDVAAFGAPENRQRLAVSVDGVRYPLLDTELENRLAAWPIPARAAPGPTDIVLHVARLQAEPGPESRQVGIGLRRLIVEPA
jgi:hypothetical protein